MIIVDSSVLTDALVDDGKDGENSRQALADGQFLVAPDLIDIEVISAIRRIEFRGLLSRERADIAVRRLRYFPVKRERHDLLLPRAWQLRDNFSPYDAVFVALAEWLMSPLLTRDARVARSPNLPCEVILLAEGTQ